MKFGKFFTKPPPTTIKQCQNAGISENNSPHEAPSKAPNMTIPPTPNIIRKMLPLAAFSLAFAVVMTVLILYMNNTGNNCSPSVTLIVQNHFSAMRHYQFRVNMSQDYELLSVTQDNPQLITYIREVHLRPAIEPHHKPLEFMPEGLPEDTAYVIKLLNNKVRKQKTKEYLVTGR